MIWDYPVLNECNSCYWMEVEQNDILLLEKTFLHSELGVIIFRVSIWVLNVHFTVSILFYMFGRLCNKSWC
jgi:hypothetical protein